VQDSEDVCDNQRAGEGADEGCADGDPGDVEHAAAGRGWFRSSLYLSGDFRLIGVSERARRPRIVRECVRGVFGRRESVEYHVEVLRRTGSESGVDYVGKAGVAQCASGDDVVEPGQCDGRLVAGGVAMGDRVELLVECPLDDPRREAEVIEGRGRDPGLSPADVVVARQELRRGVALDDGVEVHRAEMHLARGSFF
jgi:hypothetical protein